MTAKWFEQSNAQWIWPAQGSDGPNQYVQVIQNFDLSAADNSSSMSLAISADSNYAAWLNGKFVGFGQWSNFPDDKTYDVLNLDGLTSPGQNHLCLVIYCQGQSSSTYSQGKAGAVFAIGSADKLMVASGPESLLRKSPDYVSGPIAHVTGQLGFTFEHYANKEDDWLNTGYVPDGSWLKVDEADQSPLSSRPVRPRPVSKLTLMPRIPMRVVAQGVFRRNGTPTTPAEAMQSDALIFRAAGEVFQNPPSVLHGGGSNGLTVKPDALKDVTGPYLVLDTGHEEAGLLDLEIDATSGTIIDIGYGEHLDDLRVRTFVGGRHFAVRYVCKEGPHKFLHPFLRLAGRYLQLQITPPSGSESKPLTINYAGIRPTPYPVSETGKFSSSDTLHDKIWEVSRRTLELCMHEHYEDCPWREQALYAMDARNQALAGYYCFGNYEFARESIRLLGQAMNADDGFLELCAPAKVSITIPSFSLAWILMIDDYLMYSGDRDFAKSELPIARRILETCEKHTSGPLINTPTGARMWNFYEWAPGLDGGDRSNPEGRLDAPLNLFYLMALDACERLAIETNADGTEFHDKAARLRAAFHNEFWDSDQKCYRTLTGAGASPHFAELTQALAILAKVVPPNELPGLVKKLSQDNNGLIPCTISHTLYKFEALLTAPDKYATRVFELISRDWGYMLGKGATSFWETIDGADAFANAGSLCHGWSGVPAWFYGAYILGVKPTEPGFEEYEVKPVAGPFTKAAGVVPMPLGEMTIDWHLEGSKLKVSTPSVEKSQ